ESSAAPRRMKQAGSKLRGIPRLLASARENVLDPPRVYVERTLPMLAGVSDLLERELPLAFADAADQNLQRELKAAASSARRAVDAYARDLESRGLPDASGRFAVGAANVEARYRAEELIDLPAPAL